MVSYIDEILVKYVKAVATHYIYKQIAKAIDFLNEPVLSEQTVSDLLNSMSSSLTFLSDEKKKIVIKVKELEDCDDQKKEEIENQYEETNNIMHSKFLCLTNELRYCSYYGYMRKVIKALWTKSRRAHWARHYPLLLQLL